MLSRKRRTLQRNEKAPTSVGAFFFIPSLASLRVFRHDARDAMGGVALADAGVLGDIGGGSAGGPKTDHFERHPLLGGAGAKGGAAEHLNRAVDCNVRVPLRDSLLGEPVVLLLQ